MYRQYIINIIIVNKFFSFRHGESNKLFIQIRLKNNSNRNHNKNIFKLETANFVICLVSTTNKNKKYISNIIKTNF